MVEEEEETERKGGQGAGGGPGEDSSGASVGGQLELIPRQMRLGEAGSGAAKSRGPGKYEKWGLGGEGEEGGGRGPRWGRSGGQGPPRS